MEKIYKGMPNAAEVIDNNFNLLGLNMIEDAKKNENGSFLKFGNGLLICFDSKSEEINCDSIAGSLFRESKQKTWEFPHEFVEAPVVIVDTPGPSTMGTLSGVQTNYQATYNAISAFKTTGNYPISKIAIGYWK